MTPTAHYYRLIRRLRGTQAAARELAVRGVPLEVALLLLGIAPSLVPPASGEPPRHPPGRPSLFA